MQRPGRANVIRGTVVWTVVTSIVVPMVWLSRASVSAMLGMLVIAVIIFSAVAMVLTMVADAFVTRATAAWSARSVLALTIALIMVSAIQERVCASQALLAQIAVLVCARIAAVSIVFMAA